MVKPSRDKMKSRLIRMRIPFPVLSPTLSRLFTVYTQANGWHWDAALFFPDFHPPRPTSLHARALLALKRRRAEDPGLGGTPAGNPIE
jgi:hypothetical protein